MHVYNVLNNYYYFISMQLFLQWFDVVDSACVNG